MSALGSLVVKLALEHAEFTKGLDKSSQEALRFAKNSQDSFDKFSKFSSTAFSNVVKSVGGAVAAFASFSTVINQLSNSINFADEMNDIAKANEVAVGTILKLSQALSLNGGNAADASKFFSALTNSIDQAAEGSEATQKRFASLGVTLNDLRTLDGQALFEKTLQGLKAIEDPIKRNAAAMDLFGKAAKGLDISGTVDDYINNKTKFDQAEKSFKDIGTAVDKLDVFTTNLKTSLATLAGGPMINAIDYTEKYGLEVLKALPYIGRMVDLMERYVVAKNAAAGNSASGKIRKADGTLPVLRDVIDPKLEAAKREAEKSEKDALKARDDAAKKMLEAQTKRKLGAIELEYTTEASTLEKLLDKTAATIKEEDKLREDAYKANLKRMDFYQDQANKNFEEAQNQYKKLEEDRAREFEKTVDGINETFREGFANLVNGGKGSWKAFTQSLFTTFKTTVADAIYRLLAQPFVVKMVASILGVSASGAASADGGVLESLTGGGGSGSIFTTLKDGFNSLNSNVVGSIEKLGAFLSTGNGGLGDTIGGFLGQYAEQINSYLPYAGAALSLLKGDFKSAAFQAGGAFIGNLILPGVGGAIGAVLGSVVGGLFGGKKIPMVGSQASGSFANGEYTGSTAKFGKKDLGLQSSLAQINEAFTSTLGNLLEEYGLNSKVNAGSTFRSRTNVRGFFDANFEGGSVTLAEKYGKAKGNNAQAGFQQYLDTVLGSKLVEAIQKSKLPDGLKKFFDGVVDKAVVLDTINTIVGLKKALVDLPDVFKAVGDAINTTKYTTTLDQLKAQFAATQTFVGLFYSESEKFDIFTTQLSTQLEALNKVLPSSRDEYRAWVDSMNVVDEATRDQFNGLIALAPAMDQYFKLLQQQADGINEVNQALADGLNSNLYSTYADFASAKVSTAAGINASSFIGERSFTNQISAELIAEYKALRAENVSIRTVLEAIAVSVAKTATIQKQWNGDGLPAERVM